MHVIVHALVCPLYPTEENTECIDVSNIAIYNIGMMMSVKYNTSFYCVYELLCYKHIYYAHILLEHNREDV